MKIEFNLDERDYLTFYLFNASMSKRIQKKRQRTKIIVAVVYVMLGIMTLPTGKYAISALFIAVGLLWYFLFPIYERKKYHSHYQEFIRENYKNRLGVNATIEFSKDFLFAKDESSESKISVKDVEEIFEIQEYLFIRLKSAQAFVIPKKEIKELELLINKLKELARQLNVNYTVNLAWEWK